MGPLQSERSLRFAIFGGNNPSVSPNFRHFLLCHSVGLCYACASVSPSLRARGTKSRETPFAAASPRDFRRLTVTAVWLLFGDHGHRYLITCGNVRKDPTRLPPLASYGWLSIATYSRTGVDYANGLLELGNQRGWSAPRSLKPRVSNCSFVPSEAATQIAGG
jgi:hypothetical protein